MKKEREKSSKNEQRKNVAEKNERWRRLSMIHKKNIDGIVWNVKRAARARSFVRHLAIRIRHKHGNSSENKNA